MLGNDDIEVLIDEPITAAELFGEDEEEPPLIPPLSPDPDGEEDTAAAGPSADGDAADAAQPKKRRINNRLPNLNEKWITDPNKEGIYAVNKYFDKVKLKRGKGNELANVKTLLRRYEYWAQQCYPKLCFQDFVDKVETLSGKKLVKNSLQEIRNNRTPLDDITDDVADNDDANVPDDDDAHGSFLNTSEPITSPIANPFASFSTPQPTTNSDHTITDDMKEMIRRKREEAIAKRKRKLEESLNKSDVSISQSNEEVDEVTAMEKNGDTSILQQSLDSSYMSASDINEENPMKESQSDKDMEIEAPMDLKEIIRRKREQAIERRKRKLESQDESDLSLVPTNEENHLSNISLGKLREKITADNQPPLDSDISVSEINVEKTLNELKSPYSYGSSDGGEKEISNSQSSVCSDMSVSETNVEKTLSDPKFSGSDTSKDCGENMISNSQQSVGSDMSVSDASVEKTLTDLKTTNSSISISAVEGNSNVIILRPVDSTESIMSVSESNEESLHGTEKSSTSEMVISSQSDKEMCDEQECSNVSISHDQILEVGKKDKTSALDKMGEENPLDLIGKGEMEVDDDKVTNEHPAESIQE